MRNESGNSANVASLLFEKHLKAIAKLKGQPFPNGVPNYADKCIAVHSPKTAAFNVRQFINAGQPVTFDLETDRLKPDAKDAEIICCSVSNGEISVAYPWHGDAIDATLELLRSDLPKWGYNSKFETRWMLAKHKTRVRNWKWDGMLAAHVLDNRSDICGLEFQAFVRLGVEPWDSHVAPYMKGTGGNGSNKIRECDLTKLLNYCAYDSLYEWLVAKSQMKEMRDASRRAAATRDDA